MNIPTANGGKPDRASVPVHRPLPDLGRSEAAGDSVRTER